MEHKKTQHFLLKAPYYSQRLDVKDPFWQSRSCGIVALAMAMECVKNRKFPPKADQPRAEKNQKYFQLVQSPILEDNLPLSSPSLVRRGKEGEVSITSLQYKKSVSRLIEQLIHEGAAMGAWDQKHGWIHDGLLALSKKHGFKKSFRKEFIRGHRRTPPRAGALALQQIKKHLSRAVPVLVSMKSQSGGHLVLLVGFCHLDVQRPSRVYSKLVEGFYYHDPDARSRKSGAFRFISTSQLLKRWKGRIIVVKK